VEGANGFAPEEVLEINDPGAAAAGARAPPARSHAAASAGGPRRPGNRRSPGRVAAESGAPHVPLPCSSAAGRRAAGARCDVRSACAELAPQPALSPQAAAAPGSRRGRASGPAAGGAPAVSDSMQLFLQARARAAVSAPRRSPRGPPRCLLARPVQPCSLPSPALLCWRDVTSPTLQQGRPAFAAPAPGPTRALAPARAQLEGAVDGQNGFSPEQVLQISRAPGGAPGRAGGGPAAGRGAGVRASSLAPIQEGPDGAPAAQRGPVDAREDTIGAWRPPAGAAVRA